MQPLSMITTISWVFVGIIISLVLPVAVKTLKPSDSLEGDKSFWGKIKKAWKDYSGNKYVAMLVAAAVVAVVIVFLLGLEFYTARDAAMAGFAWESLVNKLFSKQ